MVEMDSWQKHGAAAQDILRDERSAHFPFVVRPEPQHEMMSLTLTQEQINPHRHIWKFIVV